ncbi:STAS domain-containing protein [Methanobrevibacter sp.]|uniref:STAS domain-containing protein n=1 Tax=Methanobrevibacter sp. TaxID=66852 RepID=UPI00388E8174
MNILKVYNEKELTLSVEGRINSVTSKELDKEINDEIGNFDSLIMDFANLEYISSAGLKVLIATHRKLKPDNIPFIIKNANDVIMEVFRLSGVDRVLKIE